jgi:2'-hydroxyisoflavone reductase
MRLLVLGGTAWLGGCVAQMAAAGGHEVTCLARGESGTAPVGVTWVRADRTQPGAYQQVADRDWDRVVDVARHPGQVESAVAALADRAATYLYVSSINVYAGDPAPGQDEDYELQPPLDGPVMESPVDYGRAKVACEQHVLRAFGAQRSLIARAGLIGGPGDSSFRSGYWPWRFARPSTTDGSVLVPDTPELMTQIIDVRDLAAWLLETSARGIFNVAGDPLTMPQHLQVARSVAGHTGPMVRASSQWLLDHDVQEWMGPRSLPLWLADPAWHGFTLHPNAKALGTGLRLRPLEQTLADTLAWELARTADGDRRSGLSDDDERELLAAALRPAGPTLGA